MPAFPAPLSDRTIGPRTERILAPVTLFWRYPQQYNAYPRVAEVHRPVCQRLWTGLWRQSHLALLFPGSTFFGDKGSQPQRLSIGVGRLTYDQRIQRPRQLRVVPALSGWPTLRQPCQQVVPSTK